MATNFPTGLDSLVNPAPTDDVSVVDHSAQHSNANDAIEALQAKVGINGSAVTSSLDYIIKNTASVNPGHKHTIGDITGAEVAEPTALVALSGQVVSALSTYTWTIALNDAGYTHGLAHVENVSSAFAQKTGAWVSFTTVAAESASNAAHYVYGAYASLVGAAILNNTTSGFLTPNSSFGSTPNSGDIRLNSVRINGANLELVFYNSVGANRTLDARLRYRVYKNTRDTTP